METSSNQSSNLPKIVGAIVAILVCCSCFAIIAAGVIGYRAFTLVPPEISTAISPTEEFTTPVPIPTLERPPTDTISAETLDTLNETLVPENDPYELGCRLERICNVPETVEGKTYQVGDQEKFWVLNSDTVEYHQIDATLLYVTPHTYFWAEDGAEVNQSDMKALMDTFENKIYPTDREFFGSEWTPGVDGDPHIYVIYASGLGESIAGLFNSTDELNPQIEENSNGHETFMLSTTQNLADEYTYSTLAHEFVHMIQFPADRNDATWMTEGFAEVGSFLNDYGVGGWDWAYAESPDLQLTDWTGDIGNNGTHYGQSFLYLAYFLDRFGEEATKALTNNPENDLVSVDDTLAQLNITDPQTGQIITADDVFMDWATALYLRDERIGDGRYTYHNFPDAPQASDTDVISDCPQSALDRTVNQYGIDYINVTCTGDFTLHFRGSTVAGLLPVDAHSGVYAFWSNKGDESNMTLTREFDFTNATAPIKLSYWTWYDIEKDWDYLHLAASTDGQNWEIITTPSGTDYDPSGASYGWSYTGQSNDWTLEEIDISQFAGQKVQIRFEYITDAAVNGEGFLLDDVRVDAINYESDFEADDGGWEAAGFARVENVLPQTYRLALITKGDTTTVTQIPLNADQTAEIPLSLASGDGAVLIVTGTTRFTRLPAAYQIEIK
jgi:immune inhibitor A